MIDAHTLVKTALARLIGETAGIGVLPADIVSPDARAHLSSPIALKTGLSAAALAVKIGAALGSPLNTLLGARMVASVREERGHLHFFLTREVLTAMMRAVIDEAPRPAMPLDADDPVDVALCRMLMLARRPFRPCPEDARVRRALWLALAIPERAGEERPTRLRKLAAARALREMAYHLPPKDRQKLYLECAGVADCAARLLVRSTGEGLV